jgi:hypothetical protein
MKHFIKDYKNVLNQFIYASAYINILMQVLPN